MSGILARRLLWVLCAAMSASACASGPRLPTERAVYEDLRRIVQHRNRTGAWLVDRYAIEQATDVTLASLCRAPTEAQTGTLAWLDLEIARRGGSAAALFRANGGDRGAVAPLLELERVRALLTNALAHAEECPFWMSRSATFDGEQAHLRSFTLVAESIGSGALLFAGGHVALGGFAGGRILPGWSLGPHALIAVGGEVGGAGALVASPGGGRQLDARFSVGIPLLLRLRDGTENFDLEVAATNRFTETSFPFHPSVRFAIAYGFSTLRTAGFLPHAALWLGYELTPARDGSPAEHAIRIGTRIGVEWVP